MDWALPTSFDYLWRSPSFPMWLTLAAACSFAVIVLFTLLRAEKSLANGALTVITLLAIGIAVAATLRNDDPRRAFIESGTASPQTRALPALSCIDELAGEAVATACEKVLFASPESTAAGVSYTASLIARITAFGDAATASRTMPPELLAMRRALERDRYGMVAQVLTAREGCSPMQCAAFRSFSDSRQIAINMTEHNYDAMVAHYAPQWNVPPSSASTPLAALPASFPTGRPTNAEFPSSASTPPVSIMNPEPGTGALQSSPRPAQPAAPKQATAASSSPSPSLSPAVASAKKQPPPKRPSAAPTQLPPAAQAPASPAPGANTDQ
jgi:hypothetical protein